MPRSQNPSPASPAGSGVRPLRRLEWMRKRPGATREYLLVAVVLGIITWLGWITPFRMRYHAFGHVYLLAVIALSTLVGRWPVFAAAVLSAVTWNYVFIPPQMSFSVIDLEDSLILGTYFTVAIIGGQLTAQLKAQQQEEKRREQRTTALYHLTRSLTGADTLAEALKETLQNAVDLFDSRSALLLAGPTGALVPHPTGTLPLGVPELRIAAVARERRAPIGRFTNTFPEALHLYVPLVRNNEILGVFIFHFPKDAKISRQDLTELIEPFVAQVALLAEREQLRASSAREKLLAESDRLHRTLFDSVSHELKTPLAVLRSSSEELVKGDPARCASLSIEIRTATLRLERLIGNLLSQSRLESGTLRPSIDWCDVRDLISAARRILGEALKGRELRLDIPDDLPLYPADALLMEPVLANLLLNAAVHTPAGTPIRVSAWTSEDGKQGHLAVEDRGAGISPELLSTLFMKFQRGPNARAGGIGLGLSIVKGFIEAQGGTVTVKNKDEGGAKFIVSLPLSDHEKVPNE